MTHVVITRLLYEDDELFQERFNFYQITALKCLKEQTKKNFDIAILCDKKHSEKIKKENIIPFFRKDGKFGERIGKGWQSFISWDNVEGLSKYDIQSNLDSDDEISNNYIETVQKLMIGDESIHLHFQPVVRNYHTGETKKMRKQYNNRAGSAFYSLYQPNKENYIFISHDGHLKMGQYMNKTIMSEGVECIVNIHDKNDSSTMHI